MRPGLRTAEEADGFHSLILLWLATDHDGQPSAAAKRHDATETTAGLVRYRIVFRRSGWTLSSHAASRAAVEHRSRAGKLAESIDRGQARRSAGIMLPRVLG